MAVGNRPLSLQPNTQPNDESKLRPASPTREPGKSTASSKRHAKGLSLNFPILLPTSIPGSQFSASPTSASTLATPIDSSRSSPHTRAVQFRTADPVDESSNKTEGKGGADFLTLLAAQERKVLELKEELQKAESDLLSLKRQWASYEATKKKDEVKLVKKLQPLALGDVTSSHKPDAVDEDVDEERRRKRAIVERSHVATATNTGPSAGSGLSRKGSKRIFEGRHTRTLSLLSPTTSIPPRSIARTSTESEPPLDKREDFQDDDNVIRPTPLRMPTLESLVSGDPLQLGFGKTYKDLAAHRRSLPPVAADMLVKQGRQVYDGVRDGLWTFFEDIRQATVGDEGVNGTAAQQQLQRQPKKKQTSKKGAAGRNKDQSGGPASDGHGPTAKEPSFWNEFGLETPHKSSPVPPSKQVKSNGHVQQKSSTDSTNPPSLLPDGHDNEEMDDGWDTWESPASSRIPASANEIKKGSGEGLPWPEIQKLTPSKLTRTVSDLMREWDAAQKNDGSGDSHDLVNATDALLSSPHI